ncbi:MAG: head GIN domain-containing protein [Bacteroidota bacterium]
MRPALTLSVFVLLSGCFNVSWNGSERIEGSGTSASRTETADGVRAVELEAPGTLVVERGAADLVIEGDDNLIERLRVRTDGGTLKIETPDGESFRPDVPLRYRVGIDQLERVEIAGSGRVEAEGSEVETLDLEVAGPGEAEVSGVRAERVSVSIAGAGDVTISGQSDRLVVEVAGAGDVDAEDLAAAEAEVSIAGAGDVTLRADKSLDVEIVGSGDVRYYGSPNVSRSIAGSGDIERAGD